MARTTAMSIPAASFNGPSSFTDAANDTSILAGVSAGLISAIRSGTWKGFTPIRIRSDWRAASRLSCSRPLRAQRDGPLGMDNRRLNPTLSKTGSLSKTPAAECRPSCRAQHGHAHTRQSARNLRRLNCDLRPFLLTSGNSDCGANSRIRARGPSPQTSCPRRMQKGAGRYPGQRHGLSLQCAAFTCSASPRGQEILSAPSPYWVRSGCSPRWHSRSRYSAGSVRTSSRRRRLPPHVTTQPVVP